MLNVLFTLDAETFPITKTWKQDNLTADMKRDLYGEIDGRVVGLEYQLQVFARHRLKAAFMIESLFSAVPEVGPSPLNDMVRAVRAGGHDIQVHAHPEWIQHIPSFVTPHRSHLLRAYPPLNRKPSSALPRPGWRSQARRTWSPSAPGVSPQIPPLSARSSAAA